MSLYLRSEARPARWADLDATQKDAFQTILQLIGEGVDGVSKPNTEQPEDKVEWLSTNRSSRTVVISGGRGTGKTTLLASLIKATTSNDAFSTGKNLPKGVLKNLTKVRRRIIWLEPMDMETTPKGANLLASILVRVEDAIARLGNVGRAGKSSKSTEYMGPGLLESGPEYHSVMLDLQRVQNAIALAWEGNLQERSSQIDPDVYAVELLRSENSRLSLNNNLDEVLNMIARKISWTANIQNPLFLLPVDDLDLNPLACLELLRLLRMISVPRIFSLILGDIYIAEIVMNLKLSGDLAQAANQGVRSPQLLSLRAEEIAAAAGEISANAMRKLIPPNQRIFLKNMDVVEALLFKPLDLSGDGSKLYHLLSQYPMSFENPVPAKVVDNAATPASDTEWSLRDFLLVRSPSLTEVHSHPVSTDKGTEPKQSADAEQQKKVASDVEKGVYTGLSVLQGTPRSIGDLWFTLNRLTRFKDESQPDNASQTENIASPQKVKESLHKKLVDAVAGHCRDILGEERGISPTQRIRFKDSIRRNIKGNWEIGDLPLKVSCDTVLIREITEKAGSTIESKVVSGAYMQKFDSIMQFNKAQYWNFEVRSAFGENDVWGGKPEHEVWFFRLSSGAAGAIVILHDLLALGLDGKNFVSPLLYRVSEFLHLAVTVWQLDQVSSIELPWSLPPCKSFWEYDIFKNAWRGAMEQEVTGFNADWAAFVWLSLGTSLVDRIEPVQSASPGIVHDNDWDAIVVRLKTMKGYGSENVSQNVVLEWLTRVFLMVMPENGMPESVRHHFVNSPDLQTYWIDHRQLILPRRTIRLASMVENNLEKLAFKMLEETPDQLKALRPPKEEILKQTKRETATGELDQVPAKGKKPSPKSKTQSTTKP